MNLHAVYHLLGQVLLLLALFLLVPACVALFYTEHGAWSACLRSSAISGAMGMGLVHLMTRQIGDQSEYGPKKRSLGTRRNLLLLAFSLRVFLRHLFRRLLIMRGNILIVFSLLLLFIAQVTICIHYILLNLRSSPEPVLNNLL